MLLANFNGKEHLRHRAVSLRQHGFLVYIYGQFVTLSTRIDMGSISSWVGLDRVWFGRFGHNIFYFWWVDTDSLSKNDKTCRLPYNVLNCFIGECVDVLRTRNDCVTSN